MRCPESALRESGAAYLGGSVTAAHVITALALAEPTLCGLGVFYLPLTDICISLYHLSCLDILNCQKSSAVLLLPATWASGSGQSSCMMSFRPSNPAIIVIAV